MQLQNELDVAIEAVRQAAEVCRRVQAGITNDILEKKDRSPVTVADFASQAIICGRIHDAFAADAIIAEEDSAELRTADQSLRDRVVDEVSQQTGGCDATSVYTPLIMVTSATQLPGFGRSTPSTEPRDLFEANSTPSPWR